MDGAHSIERMDCRPACGACCTAPSIITHMRKVPLFDAAGVATHLLVIADLESGA